MDVITDMAGEFLGNLGRTLRLYADRYSHEMSVEVSRDRCSCAAVAWR
jgi:transcriptional activator SPT7